MPNHTINESTTLSETDVGDITEIIQQGDRLVFFFFSLYLDHSSSIIVFRKYEIIPRKERSSVEQTKHNFKWLGGINVYVFICIYLLFDGIISAL